MFFLDSINTNIYIYISLPVYEVPAIRVNTTKSTYTFTSVINSSYNNIAKGIRLLDKIAVFVYTSHTDHFLVTL